MFSKGRSTIIRSAQRFEPQHFRSSFWASLAANEFNDASSAVFKFAVSNRCSRYALIAGGTPAVPVNHLTVARNSFFSGSSELAVDTQTADAAVRKDVEAQMRNLTSVKHFIFKKVSRVRLQPGTRQNTFPANRQIR